MIIEHALVHVREGDGDEFERAMVVALNIIESAPECFGAELRRQSEDPFTYLLTVRWASVEAHLNFRNTPLFDQWRELTHHFYDRGPEVTHFLEPLSR